MGFPLGVLSLQCYLFCASWFPCGPPGQLRRGNRSQMVTKHVPDSYNLGAARACTCLPFPRFRLVPPARQGMRALERAQNLQLPPLPLDSNLPLSKVLTGRQVGPKR